MAWLNPDQTSRTDICLEPDAALVSHLSAICQGKLVSRRFDCHLKSRITVLPRVLIGLVAEKNSWLLDPLLKLCQVGRVAQVKTYTMRNERYMNNFAHLDVQNVRLHYRFSPFDFGRPCHLLGLFETPDTALAVKAVDMLWQNPREGHQDHC